jgi:xylulokinase
MKCIGFDLGSSSIKAAIIDAETGAIFGSCQYPDSEMAIDSPQPGFAEQDPALWWVNCQKVSRKLLAQTGIHPNEIKGIGIAYQMHGLVCLDKDGKVLRPAIIWCDSRAVSQGESAFNALGSAYCLSHLLNSPGNFTASKLRWVQENEPEIFSKIKTVFLPGDYLAWCMTGEMNTTITGLSEGIFWDFKQQKMAEKLLNHWQIPESMLPPLTHVFGEQGYLTQEAASLLGLPEGIPVAYRAGDQPNNALSLGVLEPGEVAATGGTSGVVYAVAQTIIPDKDSRVNAFAHVNYTTENPSIGVLLCINGTGILYSWLKNQWGKGILSYTEMEKVASGIPEGSDGLTIIPFGNGAERMLNNKPLGASIVGIDFNRHTADYIVRAALEGIAFSFQYGMSILQDMGIKANRIKVGNDNLFQSAIFSQTLANISACTIEVVKTNGAAGAARGAAFGCGYYTSLAEAVGRTEIIHTFQPKPVSKALSEAALKWRQTLKNNLICV